MDVVIPYDNKDNDTLRLCVKSVLKYVRKLNTVYIVSKSNPNIPDTVWFNEEYFPFDCIRLNRMFNLGTRTGWYYQQLIKLYSLSVIPKILPNVLVVDSDLIFLRANDFMMKLDIASENHKPYFDHMNRVLPGLTRQKSDWSGVCHHMMFQKTIMNDLFNRVESTHMKPFWVVFCQSVDRKIINEKEEHCGASEYEMYFNFVLKYYPESYNLRALCKELFHTNVGDIPIYKELDYDFIAVHSYCRQSDWSLSKINRQISYIQNELLKRK